MQTQVNWKKGGSGSVERNPELIMDYYKQYEPYQQELAGNCLDVKVICVSSQLFDSTDKFRDNAPCLNEKITIVMLIEKVNQYVVCDIWGAKKYKDENGNYRNEHGEWTNEGRNPELVQFFSVICESELGEGWNRTFHVESEWGDKDFYPAIPGLKIKLVAAKKDVRFYKGKSYDVNEFMFFNAKGLSAEEIKLGIKPEDKNDLRLTVDAFKKDYRVYLGDDISEINKPVIEKASAPVEPVEPVEPVSTTETSEDDLPF